MGDYRTTTGEAPPLPPRERRRRRVRMIGTTAAVVLGVTAAGFIVRLPRAVLVSGYVTTEEYAEVRPAVAGTVREIFARSGDGVRADDLLVQLDDTQEAAALQQARGRERQAAAELARRESEIVQQKKAIEDQIAIARLREEAGRTKLRRYEELKSRGLAAASAVEDYRLQSEVAGAELKALLGRDFSSFDRELEALRDEVQVRREEATRAEAQVRLCQVRAPLAGQVVRSEFVVGERVQPGDALYEVFGGEKQVLKLRVDERYATLVEPGQRYRARLTSYAGLQRMWFEGTVETMRNVIQTEGPKTYRTAYCGFDAQGRAVPPGTTAEARIYAGRVFLWAYLLGL